jgi:hypothetical protein
LLEFVLVGARLGTELRPCDCRSEGVSVGRSKGVAIGPFVAIVPAKGCTVDVACIRSVGGFELELGDGCSDGGDLGMLEGSHDGLGDRYADGNDVEGSHDGDAVGEPLVTMGARDGIVVGACVVWCKDGLSVGARLGRNVGSAAISGAVGHPLCRMVRIVCCVLRVVGCILHVAHAQAATAPPRHRACNRIRPY